MLEPVTEADGVLLDIVYATDRVFTGRAVYARPVALLLPQAKVLLAAAVGMAAALGLRLKIFDAYRPIEAQWALWHAATDKRFVSDPRKGGIHPRGAAVDLTLVDADGCELEMGSGFDDFTALAAHGCLEISVEAQRNRAILLGIMTAAGWDNYRLEWWHYQLFDFRRYSPLSASAVPEGPM